MTNKLDGVNIDLLYKIVDPMNDTFSFGYVYWFKDMISAKSKGYTIGYQGNSDDGVTAKIIQSKYYKRLYHNGK